MATERRALEQRHRGCSSRALLGALPPLHFPQGAAQVLGGVILGNAALTRALTGGDLAHGVFGSVLGHPLPFGRAVVTGIDAGGDAGELPCRESTTMPSSHRRLRALKIPREGVWFVLWALLKN